jgi:hypothetical protein
MSELEKTALTLKTAKNKPVYHHTYYEALIKLLLDFPRYPNKRNRGYWGPAELSRKLGISYWVIKRLLVMISIIQEYADFLEVVIVGSRVLARAKPSEVLKTPKLIKIAKELGEKGWDKHFAMLKEKEEKTDV